jgi:hypothetical protein
VRIGGIVIGVHHSPYVQTGPQPALRQSWLWMSRARCASSRARRVLAHSRRGAPASNSRQRGQLASSRPNALRQSPAWGVWLAFVIMDAKIRLCFQHVKWKSTSLEKYFSICQAERMPFDGRKAEQWRSENRRVRRARGGKAQLRTADQGSHSSDKTRACADCGKACCAFALRCRTCHRKATKSTLNTRCQRCGCRVTPGAVKCRACYHAVKPTVKP